MRATFWLLDAPDSLAQQSRREPDGSGLGHFTALGAARTDRQPIAAYEDRKFAHEARTVQSRTFVAHVRFRYTGTVADRNTQPFEQRRRLFAHQGLVEELPKLEEHLGAHRALARGDTDSERLFALITKLTDENGGAVDRAIADAIAWTARNLPVYAINLVLITPTQLWALRYPDTDALYVLERDPGGPEGDRHADHAGLSGHVRMRSHELKEAPAVIVGSERLDDDPGWRPLAPGELIGVDESLRVTSRVVIDGPPARRIRLEDLGPEAVAAAHPQGPQPLMSGLPGLLPQPHGFEGLVPAEEGMNAHDLGVRQARHGDQGHSAKSPTARSGPATVLCSRPPPALVRSRAVAESS